jgi:hypothetical protein
VIADGPASRFVFMTISNAEQTVFGNFRLIPAEKAIHMQQGR